MNEYRICVYCGKQKRIHIKGEYLTDHNNLMIYPHHIEKYNGWCLRCTEEDLKCKLKFMWCSQYEAKGEKIPQWILDY